MKKFTFFIVLILFASCANQVKSLNGNWRQIFLGHEGEIEGFGKVSDSVFVKLNFKTPYQIEFDYHDGFQKDLADSIHFQYPQLNFRKLNYNQKYNRYLMKYNESCDCFTGVFNSYNGNRVKVKWVRT